jgi:ABC-type sugar transport system permease subunit
VYPVINIIISSLQTTHNGKVVWAGLNNYRLVFGDELFWTSIKNNFRLFLIVPVMTFMAIIVAAILFDKIKGWSFYQSIIFFPYILAITVVGVVFSYIFQYRGIINNILNSIGLGSLTYDWLGNPRLAIWVISVVVFWKQFGFGVILFLARLSSVNIGLYEVALIDGASWWQRLWHITIPQLAHVIEFYVTISLINMLSWVFGFVYVMTHGGPGNKTFVLEYLIYTKAFGSAKIYLASVVSVILLVIASVLILIGVVIRRRLNVLS